MYWTPNFSQNFLLMFQFKKADKRQGFPLTFLTETTIKNICWHLVFSIWFLVTGLSNEKNTIQVFLWNFIPLRIVYLSLDTERRQFKEKFPTHDSTMKQILVLETPFKVLVHFFWNTNFLQSKVLYHFNI